MVAPIPLYFSRCRVQPHKSVRSRLQHPPICPSARPRSIFCEPTEINRAGWNRSVFRDGNHMENRWRFDRRVSTPLPGTGDGERKYRNKEDWPPNDCGSRRASVPVIDCDLPSAESSPIPAKIPRSRPEPGGEQKNDGYFLDQTGGATGWNLRFSARPIPSIVHTNSKMPDNREVFDGFTFFFMSQKQTVSAAHRYTTVGCTLRACCPNVGRAFEPASCEVFQLRRPKLMV